MLAILRTEVDRPAAVWLPTQLGAPTIAATVLGF
jgi:hypothetical protein